MQIDVNLERTAEDLITEFGAGTLLRLFSAATSGGSYTSATSAVLVSGVERYELHDANGVPGTTWYKTRVEASNGGAWTDYSDPFQSTALVGYCTVDDVGEQLSLGDSDKRYNLIADMIVAVSGDIDAQCGRQFYRLPQVSGDATVYLDVLRAGQHSLALATLGAGTTDGRALDIISTTHLYVRASESSAYEELTEGTDFVLRRGDGPGVAGTDWPWEDVYLLPGGKYTSWPVGIGAVKHIGPLGFPRIPAPVARGCANEVRERLRQSITGYQQPDGVNQFGTPIFLTGATQDMRTLSRPPWVKRSWAAI
jgi:hypothetical protein